VSWDRRGTDGYRAPEIPEFNYDPSGNSVPGTFSKGSDVWALGCILFEIATTRNRRAFGSDYETIAYTQSLEGFQLPQLREADNENLKLEIICPPLGHRVPVWKEINAILDLCFKKDPEERVAASELEVRFVRLWRANSELR
jgi:serine/threonine protein kinase